MSTRMGADLPDAGRRRRRLGVLVLAVLGAAAVVWALVSGASGGPAGEPGAAGAETTQPGVTVPGEVDAATSAPPTPTDSETPQDGEATGQPATAPTDAPPDPAPGVVEPTLPQPLPAQDLTEDAPIGDAAVARITGLEAVEGAPQGPGEVAGPALRFTIELENTGPEPIPLDAAVVNVTYGEEAVPATEISGPGRVPFSGELAPGGRASATLVYLVPTEERDLVSVALEYRFGVPIAVFQGSASAAPAG